MSYLLIRWTKVLKEGPLKERRCIYFAGQDMSKPSILVTGALGQIGRVLVEHLVTLYGADEVLATDLSPTPGTLPCAYQTLDATSKAAWQELGKAHQFDQVYHLVAVLSAKGEANPWNSWDINMQAWRNVLESAQQWKNCRVFFPSSIAVFGPPLPVRVDESQVLTPTTSYGISKAAGEMWGDYASQHFGVDVRCLRLPGVIGYQTLPGGGTTDYAVDIFHKAVRGEKFTCFLAPHTRLPMIYMDDVLRGITELMEAPKEVLTKVPTTILEAKTKLAIASSTHRQAAVFNLEGFSISPEELAKEILRHYPDFEIDYQPDFRQKIAEAWPQELDGSLAKATWNWVAKHNLASTTQEMLTNLRAQLETIKS